MNMAQSSYPELETPEFESKLPKPLIENTDPQTKFVLEQLDVINQQNQWLIKAAVDTNLQVRHTNGRVRDLEDWKLKLDSVEPEKRLKIVGIISNAWIAGSALVVLLSGVAAVVTLVLKLTGTF